MESDAHEVHLDERTLNRFADGELPARSSAAAGAHLRACAACRREIQLIRALSAAIRAVPTPKPPAQLFDKIFPDTPVATVLPLSRRTGTRARPRRASRVILLVAFTLAASAAVVAVALDSNRATAGSSTLAASRPAPGH